MMWSYQSTGYDTSTWDANTTRPDSTLYLMPNAGWWGRKWNQARDLVKPTFSPKGRAQIRLVALHAFAPPDSLMPDPVYVTRPEIVRRAMRSRGSAGWVHRPYGRPLRGLR